MSLTTDHADPELVARPRRWDNRAIRRFMLTFGVVSSLFDYLTFGALLSLGVSAPAFRTAWFLESVLSEIVILLVIRTRRTLFRSRVGAALLWTSVVVAVGTVLLPYTPLAPLLGFTPLPVRLLALIAGIVAVYALASDVTKRALFARAGL